MAFDPDNPDDIAPELLSMEFYRLTVTDRQGISHQITGAKEVMREGWKNLLDALEMPDGTAPTVVRIEGMCDSADRAEHSLAIKVSEIVGLNLTKLY
jgi:hypothetical protein